MDAGGDSIKNEAAVGLGVGAVFGAVVEGDAGGVEGCGGVGEVEAAVDGCCDYGGQWRIIFRGGGSCVGLNYEGEDGDQEKRHRDELGHGHGGGWVWVE